MKFSRRGLLKGAPAAAVAGGMAANQLAQSMVAQRMANYPHPAPNMGLASLVGGQVEQLDPVEHVTHMLRLHAAERENLLKRANENGQRASLSMTEQNIDSLKSVSPVRKAEMRERAESAYHLRNGLRWIDRRVEDLRQEFPLLSYLFKDWT